MTARQVIQDLESLPPEQQAEVIEFAYQLDAKRKLSGPELSALAERMASATDPIEVARMRAEITRGFYGPATHA